MRALLVQSDHEDHCFADQSHRPGKDRYFQTVRVCREPWFSPGYSDALCVSAISVPHRVQEGITLLSHCRMASQALWASLHRSTTPRRIGGEHPLGAEKSEGRNAFG